MLRTVLGLITVEISPLIKPDLERSAVATILLTISLPALLLIFNFT